LGRIENSKSASIIRNKKKTERKKEIRKKKKAAKESREKRTAQEAHVRVRAPPHRHPALAPSLGVDWATRRRPTPVTEVFVTPFTGGGHPPGIPFPSCRAKPSTQICPLLGLPLSP